MELFFLIFSTTVATLLSLLIKLPKKQSALLLTFICALVGGILGIAAFSAFGPSYYDISGNLETLASSFVGALIAAVLFRIFKQRR